MDQRGQGSVPDKGTYLGCNLSLGTAGGSHSVRAFHVDFFFSLSVLPTLAEQKKKEKEKMSSGKDKKKLANLGWYYLGAPALSFLPKAARWRF